VWGSIQTARFWAPWMEYGLTGRFRPYCGRSDPAFDFSEADMSFFGLVIDNRDPKYGSRASLG